MAVVVYGAGGHARVILELMQVAGIGPVAGLVDDNPDLQGKALDGVPILGRLSDLATLMKRHSIDSAVIAVGSNAARKQCGAHARSLGLRLPVLVHPKAYVSPSATLGEGSVVLAGAVISTQAAIGELCIINTRASVDHDCRLGQCVHIAPGVTLAGTISVGEGTLIGVGASIIPGISIGEYAIIGAGSVIIRNVPAQATVVGSPARQIPSKPTG